MSLFALISLVCACLPVLGMAWDGGGDGGGAGGAAGGAGDAGAAGGAAGGSTGAAGGAGGSATGTTYTQADLNRILAEDRRKTMRQGNEAFTTLQTQVQDLLNGKSVDEFKGEVQATLQKLETAEQTAKRIEQQAANKVKAAADEAGKYKTMFVESTIGRALADAAGPKASTPAAAKLIAQALRERATVDEKTGAVTLKFSILEDGVQVEKQITPEAAVQILEADVSNYGPLFKSGVGGGAGGKGTDGLKKNASGAVDVSQLSMAQYAELRKTNPQALGLK